MNNNCKIIKLGGKNKLKDEREYIDFENIGEAEARDVMIGKLSNIIYCYMKNNSKTILQERTKYFLDIIDNNYDKLFTAIDRDLPELYNDILYNTFYNEIFREIFDAQNNEKYINFKNKLSFNLLDYNFKIRVLAKTFDNIKKTTLGIKINL